MYRVDHATLNARLSRLLQDTWEEPQRSNLLLVEALVGQLPQEFRQQKPAKNWGEIIELIPSQAIEQNPDVSLDDLRVQIAALNAVPSSVREAFAAAFCGLDPKKLKLR